MILRKVIQMRIPFGIQAKGFIVGILFAYFVLPMLQGWLLGMRGHKVAAE